MAGVKGRSGGHNRKTTAQLKAEGTFDTSRHRNRVDIACKNEYPEMPSSLNQDGKELWQKVCDVLPKEVVTRLDGDSLRTYCECYQLYRKVYPMYLADPLDKELRLAWQGAIDRLDRLGRQFGWTPQARAGIHMPEEKEDIDPFEEFIKERAG